MSEFQNGGVFKGLLVKGGTPDRGKTQGGDGDVRLSEGALANSREASILSGMPEQNRK